MNYYTKDIVKKTDGTISSANNTFTGRDAAYAYLYARMGSLLGRNDVVRVAMELIDENCVQYQRLTYEKAELLETVNNQNNTENLKGE